MAHFQCEPNRDRGMMAVGTVYDMPVAGIERLHGSAAQLKPRYNVHVHIEDECEGFTFGNNSAQNPDSCR